MLETFMYIFIGLLTGVSMGMIGIGAGVISMPLLIYAGLSVKQSVAIGMVMQVLPQSIPGVINYWKHILWYESALVVIASIFGIWLGSFMVTNHIIPEYIMYRMITVFLFLCAIYFYLFHWDVHVPEFEPDYCSLAT